MKISSLATASLMLAALFLPAHGAALPSYSCVFTEPFINIDSYPGGLRYVTLEGAQAAAVGAFTSVGAATTLNGRLPDGRQFNLAIVEKPASDGMSDMLRPFAGTLSGTAVNALVNGACLKFPDGTTPRPVTGVADDDVLNVRAEPHAKAAIVNTLGPQDFAWAYPEDMKKGWIRVSTAVYPPGETGMIAVVDGWVNGKFLGKVDSR